MKTIVNDACEKREEAKTIPNPSLLIRRGIKNFEIFEYTLLNPEINNAHSELPSARFFTSYKTIK